MSDMAIYDRNLYYLYLFYSFDQPILFLIFLLFLLKQFRYNYLIWCT